MRQALRTLRAKYPTNEGVLITGARALDEIRDIAARSRVEDMPWQRWAKLSKVKGTKAEEPHFAPLREAAAAFARHPRLLDQVRQYIAAVFACAAEAMPQRNTRGIGGSSISSIKTASRWNFSATPISNSS